MVSFSGGQFKYMQAVKASSDLAGQLRSDVLYVIDGAVDLGSNSIAVPAGGLTIKGHGFDVSSLTSTAALFVNPVGSHAGSLQLAEISLTSPSVFELDNEGNGGAVEIGNANLLQCASLGYQNNYRQALWNGAGVLFCDDGLTMGGTWGGGIAVIDSIVIGGFTGTVFKAGAGLSIGGSVRSNINALRILPGGVLFDFDPSNMVEDGSFSMEGVRVSANVNAFPNMPTSDVTARFKNCVGQDNTYPGGFLTFTATAPTVVSTVNELYKMAGTTSYNSLAWVSGVNDNEFTHLSSQSVDYEIRCHLSLTGNNGDQVEVVIRHWDDSAGIYIDLSLSGAVTMNPAGRAENVSTFAVAKLDQNDRIEVWGRNKSGSANFTVDVGGIVGISER